MGTVRILHSVLKINPAAGVLGRCAQSVSRTSRRCDNRFPESRTPAGGDLDLFEERAAHIAVLPFARARLEGWLGRFDRFAAIRHGQP
jgi:hypothetical protein